MWTKTLPWMLIAATLSLAIHPASAAPPPMDGQHFQPHADRTGWFVTQSAKSLGLWQPAFGLWMNYAHDPIVFYSGDEERRILGDLMTMDLQAALGFGVADIAIDMPLHLYMAGDGMDGWTDSYSGTAAGDLRVIPKVTFLDPEKRGFGLGLVLPVSFPSGNEEMFAGRSTVTFTPTLALTGHIGIVRVGGNLGYRITKAEEFADLTAGNAFTFRGAVGVAPHPVIDIGAEVYGEARGDVRNNPVEWLAGVTVRPAEGLGISIAGGTGIGNGFTAPDGRVVFGIGYAPPLSKDTDKDGIKDKNDACPEQPEDKDGFEDKDGCPDIDNDQDGILDEHDQCPDEPETKNGFEDKDGCPEDIPDTDGDGLTDDVDQCPKQPEDVDQFEDADGCPDPDNDGDKILDVNDACPNEPEVLNGVDDEDGCPDEAKAKIDLEKKEIYILDKVYFDLGKSTIKSESHAVLDAVVTIMEKYPSVKLVEVQGHTDKQGSDSSNKKLSQRRADAVMMYLAKKGIDKKRLTAVGYGEEQLVDTAETDEAHAKNRRVQFIVKTIE
jgi:large repetitive protein